MDPALINPINLGPLARCGSDCPKYAATQILEFNVTTRWFIYFSR